MFSSFHALKSCEITTSKITKAAKHKRSLVVTPPHVASHFNQYFEMMSQIKLRAFASTILHLQALDVLKYFNKQTFGWCLQALTLAETCSQCLAAAGTGI